MADKAVVYIMQQEGDKIRMEGSKHELEAVKLDSGDYYVRYKERKDKSWRATKLYGRQHCLDFFCTLS